MQVKRILSVFAISLLPTLITAQLSGRVGPLTTVASKSAKKICNVLDFGGKAELSADLGPSLSAAWVACRAGGVVLVPPGNYGMSTWQTLSGGLAAAIQLDGIIYRMGTEGGHMIIVEHSTDFEFFSSTSKGAMQGHGYEFHKNNQYGPRLIRLVDVHSFSVHDLALVDSPAFHLIIDKCGDGEIYNVIVRGGNRGGLDGMDVNGQNIWIHDVSITNKDECVTIKTPSSNILVENVWCNWSGGCALGSLGTGTAISSIHYRNIYTQNSNQMLMIKSNMGSGYVEGLTLENFIGHKNAYSLNFEQYWPELKAQPGQGIEISNVVVKGWKGGEMSGRARGPIHLNCAAYTPCHNVTIDDFAMWTEQGDSQIIVCNNAHGEGACLTPKPAQAQIQAAAAVGGTRITSTIIATPTGFTAPTMVGDLLVGLGITQEIPIPTIPASFFPGVTAIHPLLNGVHSSVKVTPTKSAVISVPATTTWASVIIKHTPTTFSRVSTAASATLKYSSAASHHSVVHTHSSAKTTSTHAHHSRKTTSTHAHHSRHTTSTHPHYSKQTTSTHPHHSKQTTSTHPHHSKQTTSTHTHHPTKQTVSSSSAVYSVTSSTQKPTETATTKTATKSGSGVCKFNHGHHSSGGHHTTGGHHSSGGHHTHTYATTSTPKSYV